MGWMKIQLPQHAPKEFVNEQPMAMNFRTDVQQELPMVKVLKEPEAAVILLPEQELVHKQLDLIRTIQELQGRIHQPMMHRNEQTALAIRVRIHHQVKDQALLDQEVHQPILLEDLGHRIDQVVHILQQDHLAIRAVMSEVVVLQGQAQVHQEVQALQVVLVLQAHQVVQEVDRLQDLKEEAEDNCFDLFS